MVGVSSLARRLGWAGGRSSWLRTPTICSSSPNWLKPQRQPRPSKANRRNKTEETQVPWADLGKSCRSETRLALPFHVEVSRSSSHYLAQVAFQRGRGRGRLCLSPSARRHQMSEAMLIVGIVCCIFFFVGACAGWHLNAFISNPAIAKRWQNKVDVLINTKVGSMDIWCLEGRPVYHLTEHCSSGTRRTLPTLKTPCKTCFKHLVKMPPTPLDGPDEHVE